MNEATPFDRRMLEALVCPLTQAVLRYDADKAELDFGTGAACLSHSGRNSDHVGIRSAQALNLAALPAVSAHHPKARPPAA